MALSKMAKKNLQQKLDSYLTPPNIVIGLFGVVSLIVMLFLVFGGEDSTQSNISEDQIRMEKNGEVITVNKNGLVEYRTGETVTYKIWDSDKVSKFFNAVENKARDYLENPPDDTSNCVWVSLYLNGELVTICFSEDDDVVQEAYEEFDDNSEESISISDLFGGEGTNEDDEVDEISDYFNITPTPTVAIGATPTPGDDNGLPDLPPPLPIEATCESWEEQIVGGRAIISNTLCSVSVAE